MERCPTTQDISCPSPLARSVPPCQNRQTIPERLKKRSLFFIIRVRTGKDPVVLLGMLSPRLYNLPDEFSIQVSTMKPCACSIRIGHV